MRKKNISICVAVLAFLASATPAHAFSDARECLGEVPNTYKCVEHFGYKGTDPYGVHKWGNPASDGSNHSCTSFAAFMLAKNNIWMPEISSFDSAQNWAVQARDRVGATLSKIPHVGDIAQWGKPTDPANTFEHVAWVDSITYTRTGAVKEIIIYDDNGGKLRSTTKRYLQPNAGVDSLRWPDQFITFPKNTSSGGGFVDRDALRGILEKE